MELQGQRQLRNRLENMSESRKVLARLQTEVTREAKHLVPRKTGNLGRSIAPGYLSDDVAFVRASARYAIYVEKGTGVHGPKGRPFDIVPRRGKALRFPAKGVPTRLTGQVRASHAGAKGAYVFARKVTIQGMRPRPFLAPAVEKVARGAGLKDVYIGLWNEGA